MSNSTKNCPVCNRDLPVSWLTPAESLEDSIKSLLAVNATGWEPDGHICRNCVERFTKVRDQLFSRFPRFAEQKLGIIPTPMRLDAPDNLRGRGVTIAFLDSGFHAHPDLTKPRDRIIKYHNLVERARTSDLTGAQASAWHGLMTSVVAAGNGYLSGGLYRGIAAEAGLVLLKVGSTAKIRHDDIDRGIKWVIRNRKRYGIRIVNISCGGDYEASYLTDGLSRTAEEATRAGLLVIAAAGNAGNDPNHPVLPPASAPSVLTVGGLDDRNNLEFSDYRMYRSSFGPTIDGLQKPEVIAPGIWVSAPILPGTPTAAQARLLSELKTAPDSALGLIIKRNPGVDQDLDHAIELPPYIIRSIVWMKIRDNNVISGHYKHVDGTSFAAPIVSSIAAQILEAAPHLKPHQVKRVLVKTAIRIPGIEVDRQGWGVVHPRAAISAALSIKA